MKLWLRTGCGVEAAFLYRVDDFVEKGRLNFPISVIIGADFSAVSANVRFWG
jgi:hypothetical protein